MNKILLILACFYIAGCSHVYVRNWGNGQVTTCCPSGKIFCTGIKRDELANEQCGGKAVPISGGLIESGASGSAWNGSVDMRVTNDSCVTYECGKVESPIFTKQ